MDESTHRVTADEAEQPKDNKNQSDSVEHGFRVGGFSIGWKRVTHSIGDAARRCRVRLLVDAPVLLRHRGCGVGRGIRCPRRTK